MAIKGVRLYCGIAETRWNYHPVQSGDYACVSPVKGRSDRTKATNRVSIPAAAAIIQDSGAFSDSWSTRLDFASALDRQINHADRWHYTDQISHRATYDLLIDEVWDDGNRAKRRWTVGAAEDAVETTVAAARYLDAHRDGLSLVVSAQGVDALQYLRCAERLMSYMRDGDFFGFGGWCILGKLPAQMMPIFRDTVATVIPFLAREGVRHVHIWGVIYPRGLGVLYRACVRHGLTLSTDSVGPSMLPIYGQWGYGDWRDNTYARPPVETRGLERARHVRATSSWLENFALTQYAIEPLVYSQASYL